MVEALSQRLFRQAKRYIPSGVNSPVRSFCAVGGYPLFINRARGAKIYDESGEEFIDYCLAFGSLILGHAHPQVVKTIQETVKNGTAFGTVTRLETELSQVIAQAIPAMQQLRLTNSGTEAVMSAIRLARGYTKRDKIIKFAGSYHGHADYLLDCLGVPKDFSKHTLICPYNDTKRLKEIIGRYKNDIAAIIVEPVAANMGVVLARDGFLQALKQLSVRYNIVLIFDEVVTGFRLTYGGAQELFAVKPDLTCLGKIIGGGLPIGAFGGRKEIMRLLAPQGPVYQAGTFSGNPISVRAGLTALKTLAAPGLYARLEKITVGLCAGLKRIAREHHVKLQINFIGSMFSIFFTGREVIDYNIARMQDAALFRRFYHGLLKEGIYFSPSGLEAQFLCVAHSVRDIDKTLAAAGKTLKSLTGG